MMLKILNPELDLSYEAELDLIHILRDLCRQYDMCYHEISDGLGPTWASIVLVAREIVRRG